MIGRVATGLSVGGFATVVAGVVIPSLLTIALVLAGLAGLGLVSLVGQPLLDEDRVRPESFGTIGGVGTAAALVTVFSTSNVFPGVGSSTIGTGVFVTGFLLYIGVWEYERPE